MILVRRVLELARGDFLERSRRSGFLLTLGGAAGLAYTVHAGVWTVLVGSWRPAPGPAATGTLVAVVTTFFLSLAGFYVVRGAVERDRRTRVGPILLATPATRLQYALGKFLSNAAVLGAMLLVLVGLALVIAAHRAGGLPPDGAWRVISPSLLITAPMLVTVAGVAVLFDAVPWLDATAGNIAYFFLWAGTLTFLGFDTGGTWTDVTGVGLVFEAMQESARAVDPTASAEGITLTTNQFVEDRATRFPWSGVGWTLEHTARRLWWAGVGGVLTVVAGGALRIFDPFGDRSAATAGTGEGGSEEAARGAAEGAGPAGAEPGQDAGAGGFSASGLTPPAAAGPAISFLRTLRAESRLLLSGHAWWWYLGLAGANAAAFLVPADQAGIPLLIAWLLPIGAWSAMGCRERMHGTEQLLFSSPRPRLRQLPAQLAAGVLVAAVAAAGPIVRLAAGGEASSLAALGVGALFVPALALALGAWTGKEKTFQATYLVLWYLGPMNGVPALDFMGVTGRALEARATPAFLAAAGALFVLAWLGRGRRLRAVS